MEIGRNADVSDSCCWELISLAFFLFRFYIQAPPLPRLSEEDCRLERGDVQSDCPFWIKSCLYASTSAYTLRAWFMKISAKMGSVYYLDRYFPWRVSKENREDTNAKWNLTPPHRRLWQPKTLQMHILLSLKTKKKILRKKDNMGEQQWRSRCRYWHNETIDNFVYVSHSVMLQLRKEIVLLQFGCCLEKIWM